MPIFRGRLVFNKETEEKHRWITSVHGVQFKIYITQKRVPEPVPMEIEASVFDSKFLYRRSLDWVGGKAVRELPDRDRAELEAMGVNAEALKTAGPDAIFGAVWKPKEDHTETVRYNAYRGEEELEFGDPYIPKSLLREPCPDRLLFLIRWIP
jgi:hypothetical protein